MPRTDVVIIGGGQAGLAMSRCLSDRNIAHVVLERGRVAERWQSERWDSLRLLTPNWMTRLPGRFSYDGSDPRGFMTVKEVVQFFHRYAQASKVPLEPWTTVEAIEPQDPGFRITTDRGIWCARAVVIATGYSDRPAVPPLAARLSSSVEQIVPGLYRNPGQLAGRGVLVVGASASGLQIADELLRAGRAVTIAAGHHMRVPRVYRGHDIYWWLDRLGLLDESADGVYDLETSRQQPSLQLSGRSPIAPLDLRVLRNWGARVVGRLVDADGDSVQFADDLVSTTAAADVKLAALLARIDRHIDEAGETCAGPREEFVPHWPLFVDSTARVKLAAEGIGAVVWATGFHRRYPWLEIPVLDERGEVRHDGGITPWPGLYMLGLQFMRRRRSNFIDGVGADAEALADHAAAFLGAEQAVA